MSNVEAGDTSNVEAGDTSDVEAGSGARHRPRSLDPQELGFTPRRPVGLWSALFRSRPLAGGRMPAGSRPRISSYSGGFFDHSATADGELWFDHVAAPGDGFDATYSVAWLVARARLTLAGVPLPRGRLLLMGGDLVAPYAGPGGFEDRTEGPYRAARPEAPAGRPRPVLFAVPGAQEQRDGLTTYLDRFVFRKDYLLGGWRTRQQGSYVAVKLPHGWWLWATDGNVTADLDDPQRRYFTGAAREISPGDRVIVMIPAPTWTRTADEPGGFLHEILAPTGARIRVLLAGGVHHYARYSGPDRELITGGGGGAHLHPTHPLPPAVTLPTGEYRLAGCYPDARGSRRAGWRVFRRLPRHNPGFAALLGAVQTLLMLTLAGAGIYPYAILMLILILGTVWFAAPVPPARRRPRNWLLGVAHGLAHGVLAAAGTWLWTRLPVHDWSWPVSLAAAAVLYAPVAALVAGQLTAAYLLVAARLGVNVDELYAGVDDQKSFLRLHIAGNGTLTIYPIAVDRVGRRWSPRPDGAEDDAWLDPGEDIRIRLAEPPIVISPF